MRSFTKIVTMRIINRASRRSTPTTSRTGLSRRTDINNYLSSLFDTSERLDPRVLIFVSSQRAAGNISTVRNNKLAQLFSLGQLKRRMRAR